MPRRRLLESSRFIPTLALALSHALVHLRAPPVSKRLSCKSWRGFGPLNALVGRPLLICTHINSLRTFGLVGTFSCVSCGIPCVCVWFFNASRWLCGSAPACVANDGYTHTVHHDQHISPHPQHVIFHLFHCAQYHFDSSAPVLFVLVLRFRRSCTVALVGVTSETIWFLTISRITDSRQLRRSRARHADKISANCDTSWDFFSQQPKGDASGRRSGAANWQRAGISMA